MTAISQRDRRVPNSRGHERPTTSQAMWPQHTMRAHASCHVRAATVRSQQNKPPDSHPPTGPPCFQQPWTQTTRYFPSNVAPTYSTHTPDKCLPDETPKRDNLYQPANSRGLAHPPSNSKTFCKPGNSLGLMHPHSVPVELARLKDLMHMCSLTHATQGLVKF